jgi:hypothetical protein
MEAQRTKNFKKIYKSTSEHSVNIHGYVRLTLLSLYPGWTNQPVLTMMQQQRRMRDLLV